jgi:hypothetical protein
VTGLQTVEPTNNHAWREPFGVNKASFFYLIFFLTQEKGNHSKGRQRTIIGLRFSHDRFFFFFFFFFEKEKYN